MCSIATEDLDGTGRPDGPPHRADERSLDALENEICTLAAHLAAATCRWLLLIAEFDARGGWAEWGVKSCAHWLSWRCGIGLTAGREHVRVARVLRGLPLVQQAFASGELSYSKVRALTRVASEKTEAQLLELARHATGAQLEKVCRQYGGVLRSTAAQAQAAYERQQLTTYWDEDGMLVVQGRLTAEDGAALMAALDQTAAAVPEDVRSELGARAVRAQALATLATAGAPATEVVVHVDVETLTADDIKRQSEVADGPALAPETIRRLGCDAGVVTMIERDGKPLSVGRRTRAIPPALRRALRSRDRGCRFPGCTHSRHLHAHHIEHWARGGSTEIGNLVQLCSYHHQLVHEGGYRVRSIGGRVEFRRPDGRVISERCGSRRASGLGIAAQHQSRRMAIGPDTCRPLSAGDRLDYDIAVGGLAWWEFGPEPVPEPWPEPPEPLPEPWPQLE